MRSIFARLDEKRYLQEILRKFWKIFLSKLQKMHYFSIFFQNFNKPMRSNFARLDEKRNVQEIFEKIT